MTIKEITSIDQLVVHEQYWMVGNKDESPIVISVDSRYSDLASFEDGRILFYSDRTKNNFRLYGPVKMPSLDEIKKVPKCHRGRSKQEAVLGKETILRLYNENFELEGEDAKTELDTEVVFFIEQRAKEMEWPHSLWNHGTFHLSTNTFYKIVRSSVTVPKEAYPD